MKTTHIFLSLILFFIYTNIFLASSVAGILPPVVDTDGNNVQAGVNYYILPVIRGRGGGLTLASTGNKACPLDVVQEQQEVKNGLPLTFQPVNSEGVVRVWTDHNIKFHVSSTCVQSTVWKLDDYDESSGKYFVTTGGVEGNPGRDTINNWFKIEKYGRDYKLVYCPTVCIFCRIMCRDVGIYVVDGKRRLALTDDEPFRVVFKKV